jgi:hypothetical protein
MGTSALGAGSDRTPTEPLVLMGLGAAYAAAGVGLFYGLPHSMPVFWAFLAGTLLLVAASARVISTYHVRRRDVVALGGLALLLVPYVLYTQIDRHFEIASPHVPIGLTTVALPALAGAVFGYETRRPSAVRTGLRGYAYGLSRYVAVGVTPLMVTSGFVGTMIIGRTRPPTRLEYVTLYTIIGLLMTGIAILGALLGYTTGYAAGARNCRSR